MRIAALLMVSFWLAQDAPPVFEVAAIHVNREGPAAGSGFHPSPGRFRVTNTTFEQMIQAAYHVRTGTLFGVTGWMGSERFDIDAKTPGKSTFDEDLVMLRALLVDRFQLRFHRETRELRILAVVGSRNGPSFQASKDQSASEHVTIRPGEISGTDIPIGHFVSILEAQMGAPLVNDTGLSGKFDLALKYNADLPVYEAIQEQLGLKLDARKGPVDVLVIDSAARPGEN